MKKNAIPNRYKLTQETEPTPDNHFYRLGEAVRKAFEGLTNNLFDHIRIEKVWTGKTEVRIEGESFISLKAGDAFDFLSSARFTHDQKAENEGKECWDLRISEMDDGFGIDMSVTGKTPRECVRAMIQERKNWLRSRLKKLNRFPEFQDYTHLRHCYC